MAGMHELSVSGIVSNKGHLIEGMSLYVFSHTNPIRVFLYNMVHKRQFEMFILFIIAIQSVLLAMDNPLNDPNSIMVQFLTYLDIVMTSIFLSEALMKIISFGFLFNGPNSYLKNGWNIIDISVVFISFISYAFTS